MRGFSVTLLDTISRKSYPEIEQILRQMAKPMVLEKRVIDKSVQQPGLNGTFPSSGAADSLVIELATVADSFTPWGSNPARRDRELRSFWVSEPILASALYSIAIRNAAFSWTLEGPPSTVEAVQHLLHTADLGAGWQSFIVKIATDLFSQDNGAFIEIIRESDSPTSAILGLGHLDAGKCRRTGDPEFPVNYWDRKGVIHKMAWYQVAPLTEFPSPIESMNGMQLCAVSRVLRAAQYLRDVSVYQNEKVSGNNPTAIHLVSGISTSTITDAMEQHKLNQAQKGMTRWIVPLVLASLDPTASVTTAQIDLKTLPDGFDIEEAMKWYINQLALGFGADYQDFAPLPGGNLGSSSQSRILHQKSRGKGPAFFMKMLEYSFNFQGLMPSNVTFSYDEQDNEGKTEEAEMAAVWGETLDEHVASGILTPDAARQILLDLGLMSQEVFDSLQDGSDITPDIVAPDDERAEKRRHTRRRRKKPKKGEPGYRAKAIETPSDFAEEERLEAEEVFAQELEQALALTFTDAKKLIGRKALIPFGSKTPNDLLTDAAFWETFRTRMVLVGTTNAREGALAAAQFNLDLGLAVDMDLVNQGVLEFTTRYSNEWWQQLSQTTRSNLNKAVVSWQESGLGRRGLPSLVDAIEPMFSKSRAQLIAANESTLIFDQGNLLAHKSAGITTEEWQTVRDARVDDICRPLDGQQFPIDSGPRPVTGTHIGCRCARLPVGTDGNAIGGR